MPPRPTFQGYLVRAETSSSTEQPCGLSSIKQASTRPTTTPSRIRAFVLWRKRSFGTQGDRGNTFAENLISIAHTARKQQRNVLAFLTACCRAARNKVPPPSLFGTAAV
jgi:hypothetical protein